MLKLILKVLFVFAFFTSSWGRPPKPKPPTACQTHSKYPNMTGLLVNVRCDKSGFYKRKQCTVVSPENALAHPKMCACHHREGPITQFSSSIKSCKCIVAKYKAEKKGASKCDTPSCLVNGLFRAKTCCSSSVCSCQDTSTGDKIATGDRSLTCCRGALCKKLTPKPKVMAGSRSTYNEEIYIDRINRHNGKI